MFGLFMKFKLNSSCWPKAVVAMLAGCAVTTAYASTDITVWHSLQQNNAEAFKSLVKNYNNSQSDIKVNLRSFASAKDLEQALVKANENKSLPDIAHIGDTHTLDEVANRPYVQPFYTIQNLAGLNKVDWFVKDSAYIRDFKGRLMVFPYMLEVPVMYYNLDSFKKANIQPPAPKRVWIELQSQLVQMANNGSRKCPLTSDLPVSINLENLAAVNNQLFASADNGLKAKGLPSFSFDSTYVRHLSLMISWVRSEIMNKPDAGVNSVQRFAAGECAVLMSNSGHLGEFSQKSGLNYAITGLPYYPEVTKKPGNPFITGAGLWLMKSAQNDYKAAANFLSWLAQPEVASKWYQQTGYLPLSQQAFKLTPAKYFDALGDWGNVVQAYSTNAAPTAKGLKIKNYSAIRVKFHEILDTALNGNQPAVTALNNAAAEANRLVLQ